VGDLHGRLDRANWNSVAGWAVDAADPAAPVVLEVLDNDQLVARVVADQHRPDLAAAGVAQGRCAFFFAFPTGLSALSRHVLRVRRESDGRELPNSPAILDPAASFTPALEKTLEGSLRAAIATAHQGDDLDEALRFLVAQTDRLMKRRRDLGDTTRQPAHAAFRERWQEMLPQAEDAAPASPSAAPRAGALRRALFIDDKVPTPDQDAGSRAILSHMESFLRLGVAVGFVGTGTMKRVNRHTEALEARGIECFHAPYFLSIEDVLQRNRGLFDIIYLHRIDNFSKYGFLCRHYFPAARIVYSVADLHHVRMARRGLVEELPDAVEASRQLRRQELMAAASADVIITHSTFEADLLKETVPDADVRVIPWAVDAKPRSIPFASRFGLAFIGGYSHTPNVDAARWLLEHIMPLVWQRDPTIECLLVGSRLPDELRQMASGRVLPIGQIDDLDLIFDRVRLTVAPLRYGAGVKGKVVDSLAAGIPCVCTSIGAEGLGLPPELQAYVSDDPAEFARMICRLHADAGENEICAEAALHFAATMLSRTAVDRLMRNVVGTGDPLPTPSAPAP
jgi:glycosyltransferase involved in cell wall biosynthesis